MIAEITALLGLTGATTGVISSAATAAKDIKALFEKPEIDVTGAKQLVSELYDKLIKAQTDHIAIKSAVLDLHEEQRRVDHFAAHAARYALVETDMGALVYELKEASANGEPIHCLCTACYEKQVKSILQPVTFNTLGCPACSAQFRKGDRRSSAVYGSATRRGGFDTY